MAAALQQAFWDAESQLNKHFLEREEVTHGLMLALIARQHVFLLGPPGVAKSDLVGAVAGSISGAVGFKQLFTRFTVPEEVMGPLSLPDLEQGRYVRITTGALPEAHVGILDECFKASSAILNAMLTALNEREFKNGTSIIKIPLITAVGASNELPQGEDLGALYDRFLLRYYVPRLSEAKNVALLLSGQVDPTAWAQPLSLDLLTEAGELARKVKVPDPVLDRVLTIKSRLAGDGIVASDRRWKQALRVVRAEAWVHGEKAVQAEHLSIFVDMLWDTPEQRRKVVDHVLKHVNPLLHRALSILDMAVEQRRLFFESSEETRKVEASAKVRKLWDEIEPLANSTGATARVKDAADKVKSIRLEISKELMA
jgi:MoxR-like ATPase